MTPYTGSDIYCDVILPGGIELDIIKETDNVLAYSHTKPHWQTHIIIIPKRHVLDITELAHQPGSLAKELLDVVAEVAESITQSEGGCTVFTAIGDSQASKHLHIHVHNGDEITQ